MAHNGNVANYTEMCAELREKDNRHLRSGCDVEVVLNVFAAKLAESGKEFTVEAYHKAVDSVFKRVRGAYSVVGFVAGQGMFAFRDPFGIKPIVLGRRAEENGYSYAVASESIVLTVNGYELMETPAPGEAIFIDLEGSVHRKSLMKPQHHPCVFEYVYFARPDSKLEGVSVYHARMAMGKQLAQTFRDGGYKADVVIPIPDSARNSALAMAQELDIPYREALVKNRYVGRTFIMRSNAERMRSIKQKLSLIEDEFRGKDVLLVDDSIVRGNTSREIVRAARKAGARRVLFASMAPPLIHQCVYGIDMSTRKDFVARDRTVEEVATEIGADAVIYQKLPDLIEAVSSLSPEMDNMCEACFSGNYPTGDITKEMLLQIEDERLLEQA